jgi:hypothetical protein
MDKPSQFATGAKIKCGYGKSRDGNRDIEHVEEKDGHWVILFGASLATSPYHFVLEQAIKRRFILDEEVTRSFPSLN